jgi:SRSO17 transposase
MFRDDLRSKTRYYTSYAHQYLCGLFQSERRNIEKMSEQVSDSQMQQLQHFISESPWDWEPVFARVSWESWEEFSCSGGPIGLLIDESGWLKRGKHSVGVSRQYLGSEGKVDNGQVAVVGSLCQGHDALLIDVRLYLPESWTEDESRCAKAGIPPKDRHFRTKQELAIELVTSAWDRGLSPDWVGGDGAYGHDSKFRNALDQQDQFYLLDVHQTQQVYLTDPAPMIAQPRSKKGRPPKRLTAQSEAITAKELLESAPEGSAKVYTFRQGTKGVMKRKVWTWDIYTWDGQEQKARPETLIISTELNGSDPKFSLANNHLRALSDQQLLYRQMQRFWVEQSIKDAKSELGMDQYQIRTWKAWQHHMALTCMALLYMLKMKISYREDIPLLSCNDIRFILAQALPRKATSEQIAFDIVFQRHKRRQADIERNSRIT